MATPIKNTPTLEGEDAKNFMIKLVHTIINLESNRNKGKKINELRNMEDSYKVIQSISNGVF
jgi:hypothetical protein